MRRARRASAIALGSLLIVMIQVSPVRATPGCSPLTATDDSYYSNEPSVSADASSIAFRSSADLVGDNPDHNEEIFLYDKADASLVQVTTTTQPLHYNTPSISADGTRIVFRSADDIGGGNPDRNSEIFLYDATGPTVTQLTDTTGGAGDADDDGIEDGESANREPALSGDGTRVAFTSDRNHDGSNSEGNDEVFLWDESGPSITHITATVSRENTQPSISAAGDRVSFVSNGRFGGGNADRNYEVFLWDEDGPTIAQASDTSTGFNQEPSLAGDGTLMSYWYASPRPQGRFGSEIYLYDAVSRSSTRLTPHGTQNGGGSFGVTTWNSSISADGSTIAFISIEDLVPGQNTFGNTQVFTYDIAQQTMVQRSDTSGGGGFPNSSDPSISADGSQVAFSSSSNIGGSNANNNGEIFLSVDGGVCDSPGRPDGRIKRGRAGAYVGDDVYNGTGAGQTATGAASASGVVSYYVSFQNDDTEPDQFRLRGGSSSDRFAIRYFVGGENVTGQVTDGTYLSPSLASGETVLVRVQVTVKTTAPRDATFTRRLTATSVTDSSGDTVKSVTSRL